MSYDTSTISFLELALAQRQLVDARERLIESRPNCRGESRHYGGSAEKFCLNYRREKLNHFAVHRDALDAIDHVERLFVELEDCCSSYQIVELTLPHEMFHIKTLDWFFEL